MRHINLFYITTVLVGLLLWQLNKHYEPIVVSFYGFAENKEIEINFNYPTAVGKIYVSPGEFVKKGEPLLDLYRIKPKEIMDDKAFKIQEVRARQKAWQARKEEEIQNLQTALAIQLEGIDIKIKTLEKEKAFQESLFEDLQSIDTSYSNYQPITNKIVGLNQEKSMAQRAINEKVEGIREELKLGNNPYQIQINRINAESQFEQDNKITENQLVAPSDGVVGNIHCRAEEHIPSFKTLVTFYEPNPTLVSGFVHEDLILHVGLKDSFMIRSHKEIDNYCYGKVTGLGSRIVEIPERLRKIPEIKTYGREVLIQIPSNNKFLQKEKVILNWVNPPENLIEPQRKKPLVDLKLNQ